MPRPVPVTLPEFSALLDAFEQDATAAFAANPGAKLAYVETPSNPTMAVVDIKKAAEAAFVTDVSVPAACRSGFRQELM